MSGNFQAYEGGKVVEKEIADSQTVGKSRPQLLITDTDGKTWVRSTDGQDTDTYKVFDDHIFVPSKIKAPVKEEVQPSHEPQGVNLNDDEGAASATKEGVEVRDLVQGEKTPLAREAKPKEKTDQKSDDKSEKGERDSQSLSPGVAVVQEVADDPENAKDDDVEKEEKKATPRKKKVYRKTTK